MALNQAPMQVPQKYALACFLAFVQDTNDAPGRMQELANAKVGQTWTDDTYAEIRKEAKTVISDIQKNPTEVLPEPSLFDNTVQICPSEGVLSQ
jgi:hypothetical protein